MRTTLGNVLVNLSVFLVIAAGLTVCGNVSVTSDYDLGAYEQ